MDVYVRRFDARGGPVTAWVFATRGLARLGHRELLFAVSLHAGEAPEAYPADVADFFRAVFQSARQGRSVDVGGRSVFQTPSGSFLGRKDFGGMVYTWVPPGFEGIADEEALLAVLLTANEMAVADACGHTRVLARLGEYTRFYPVPAWADRDRPDVVRPGEMASSLLAKVPRLQLSRSAAYTTPHLKTQAVEDEAGGMPDFVGEWRIGPVTLDLCGEDARRLKSALADLPPATPFALLTCAPPSIAHCMVWNPEQATSGQARMISDYAHRADLRYAGNFLMVVGAQPANRLVTTEDGFALLLTDADQGRVRRAVVTGRSLTVTDAAGGVLVEVHPVR